MATDSDTKLTRYTSAVTVVTAEVMNALYGGEYGYNTTADEYDPVVYGHVHDGEHVDGHASKVYLTNGEHVRGQLAHKNLGGYDGTTPAVQVDNIQCYPEDIYNKPAEHAEQLTIPEYTESAHGVRCYYLDLSMTIGGEDTHVQYNKDGEFGGDAGFVYDYTTNYVGIGTDDPHKLLHLEKIDTYPVIQLSRKESNLGENQSLGRIQFGGTTDDGVTYDWNSSMIRARTSEVWDTAANTSGSRLEFYTTPNGSHTNSIKVTIDGDGFVGIGAQTPAGTELLYVEGDAYINGKLTVTGLIDPTGLVLTPEDPANIPTGEAGAGAYFISDGTSPAVNADHPYFKDANGSVVDLLEPVIDLALNDLNDVDTTSVGTGDTILYSAGQGWLTGSPGGSPGGADTNVQFNDSGSFNGNDGFLYNKDDGTGGSHPTITLSNRSPSDADSGRMTEVAFEGFLAGDTPGVDPATLMAQLQVSHSGSGADSKAQADLYINDSTGPQHVMRVAHNGYTGIGAVSAGEPVRRLHIKDGNDNPPLRINNLTKKTGHVMVWEDATGDVFYDDAITNNVQPKKTNWQNGTPDILIEKADHGKLLVIHGQNGPQAGGSGPGKVVLPTAPGNPTEWDDGNNFWIKNMSKDGSNEEVSIALKPDQTAPGTQIDGDTDDLTIEYGASYHLTCLKGGVGEPNEWFVIACCGGAAQSGQDQASNNAGVPDIQLSTQDGGVDVNDGDNVTASEKVTVDGSGSADTDGDVLQKIWTWSIGGVVQPDEGNVDTFTIDTAELTGKAVVIKLKVNDGSIDSEEISKTFNVVAANQQPVASIAISIAGNGEVGDLITADGTGSSDPDGDTITYAWAFDAVPGGSNITDDNDLNSANDISSQTWTPDVAGAYTINLTVTDEHGYASTPASASIVAAAANQQPAAAISGLPEGPETGSEITVYGVTSSDPDGDSLTYAWTMDSVPDTSSVPAESLGTASSAAFTPDVAGTYTVGLTVTDEHGLASDKVTADITVAVTSNEAPTASFKFTDLEGAEEKVYIPAGQQYLVYASDSSDSDGSIVSYEFTRLDGFGGNAIGEWTQATSTIARQAQDGPGYEYWRVRVSDNNGAWSAPVEKKFAVVGSPILVEVPNDKFVFNDNQEQAPVMHGGVPYLFDQTHASLAEGGHKLLFARNADSPSEYFCTSIGTPGNDGYLLFEPPLDPQDAPVAYQVWAYCKSHGVGMGGVYNPILILT